MAQHRRRAWLFTPRAERRQQAALDAAAVIEDAAEAGAHIEEIGPGVWRHSGEGVTWVPLQDG